MKYTRTLIFMLAGISLAGLLQKDNTARAASKNIDTQFHIRVLLFDNISICTLIVDNGFEISGFDNFKPVIFKKPAKPVKITIANGKFDVLGRQFAAKNITITPHRARVFSINGDHFRGTLHLIADEKGDSFRAINSLPMKDYLNGVISAEMPYYWEQQALQAQAIAARTYCWFIKNSFGTNRQWDVRKTQASQVYKGLIAETARTREAVKKTAGKILICRHDDGSRKPFPAYYCSNCGGHTENSKNVFGDSFTALTGVDCPFCRKSVKSSLLFWPMAQFDKKTVTQRIFKKYPNLKELKSIKNIVVTKEIDHGKVKRIAMVKLIGSNGREGFLRGEDLRLTIDPTGSKIKSAACKIVLLDDKWTFIAGRGYGHGVGMCQYGALAMARNGRSARQILSYYYPSSKIKKLY